MSPPDLEPFFRGLRGPLADDAREAAEAALRGATATILERFPAAPGLAEFLAALAGRLEDHPEGVVLGVARAHIADLYVADRAGRGDSAAIAWFERECVAPLGPIVGAIDPSPAFVDEIRQRVRTRLLVADGGRPPRIVDYAGRGELGAWIRVIAVREALAERRRPGPTADEDALVDVGASITSPELGLVKERYRVEFEAAFREAMAGLQAEQRNLLRHHYLHGLTLDQLAPLLGVHRSSVARRIARARQELLAATRRSLSARLQTSRGELEELLALIESRIDLSIERHLGA
ncbi:MAG: sigma-70 family RNA polymerase sigma factor [Nannocystaceae bacterium]